MRSEKAVRNHLNRIQSDMMEAREMLTLMRHAGRLEALMWVLGIWPDQEEHDPAPAVRLPSELPQVAKNGDDPFGKCSRHNVPWQYDAVYNRLYHPQGSGIHIESPRKRKE